jgi:hypothetical protein
MNAPAPLNINNYDNNNQKKNKLKITENLFYNNQNYNLKILKSDDNQNLIMKIESNDIENSDYYYQINYKLQDLYSLNKFFRQFDTIDEIFEYFNDLDNISNNTTIFIKNKFAKLNIKLPNISKSKTNNSFLIEIQKIELKENDLIVKICEQVKKIDILETKIKFLFCCSGKNEKDFESFDKLLKICEKNINESDLEDSNIICKEDFTLVLEGINRNL